MIEAAEQELAGFPDEVKWRFRRADGYLDLGMVDCAHRELDRVPETYLQGIVYNEFLLRLYFAEEDWSVAARLARSLLESHPDNGDYWIKYAYATRRHRGIADAERILTEALRRCPDAAMIQYNLACYACARGEHTRALNLVESVIRKHPGFLELALDDEDLAPIADQLD